MQVNLLPVVLLLTVNNELLEISAVNSVIVNGSPVYSNVGQDQSLYASYYNLNATKNMPVESWGGDNSYLQRTSTVTAETTSTIPPVSRIPPETYITFTHPPSRANDIPKYNPDKNLRNGPVRYRAPTKNFEIRRQYPVNYNRISPKRTTVLTNSPPVAKSDFVYGQNPSRISNPYNNKPKPIFVYNPQISRNSPGNQFYTSQTDIPWEYYQNGQSTPLVRKYAGIHYKPSGSFIYSSDVAHKYRPVYSLSNLKQPSDPFLHNHIVDPPADEEFFSHPNNHNSNPGSLMSFLAPLMVLGVSIPALGLAYTYFSRRSFDSRSQEDLELYWKMWQDSVECFEKPDKCSWKERKFVR